MLVKHDWELEKMSSVEFFPSPTFLAYRDPTLSPRQKGIEVRQMMMTLMSLYLRCA